MQTDVRSTRRGTWSSFTRHDPNRFFKSHGKWYFHTREGTDEGPFSHPDDAENELDAYISIISESFYLPE